VIKINNKEFKNKTQTLSYFKKVLNSYSVGQFLSDEHQLEILDLLKFHENYEHKLGCGISKIQISTNFWSAKAFLIHRIDGSTTDFSYLKCLNPPTFERNIYTCCRNAIFEDIKPLIERGKHLHHEEISFKKLVDDWMKTGIKITEEDMSKSSDDNNIVKHFVNNELTDSFRKYHKENAKMVLLTIDEHRAIHREMVKE